MQCWQWTVHLLCLLLADVCQLDHCLSPPPWILAVATVGDRCFRLIYISVSVASALDLFFFTSSNSSMIFKSNCFFRTLRESISMHLLKVLVTVLPAGDSRVFGIFFPPVTFRSLRLLLPTVFNSSLSLSGLLLDLSKEGVSQNFIPGKSRWCFQEEESHALTVMFELTCSDVPSWSQKLPCLVHPLILHLFALSLCGPSQWIHGCVLPYLRFHQLDFALMFGSNHLEQHTAHFS